jgi:predicted nucleotide-binding protein (sugar kinase/HSP70/actin superfamily)
VSLDIPGKLRKLGVLTIPMDFLTTTGSSTPRFQAKDGMYWKYAQRIIKACKTVRNDSRLHAVYLTNFSCGPDSFIGTFFKDLMSPKPYLMLEIDEHSADAGVVTRLEAFLESLRNAKSQELQPVRDEELVCAKTDCGSRTIYVPWMGDHAHALTAAFRGSGQPSEVLPLADAETLELGRRYTTGKECLPCIITTGDMVKKLRSPSCDPNRAAFFMPGGSGPCRFGQYNCLQRLVLNEIGCADVPIASPTQDKSFYQDFEQFKQDPTKMAWVGIVGIDILTKTTHALRPYEIVPGEVNRVYAESSKAMCLAIEQNRGLSGVVSEMEKAADAFSRVKVDRSKRKPLIGIIGEIYVRSHTFSNDYLIDRLEKLGVEVTLASFGEWMYYTNFTRKRTSKRERNWRSLLRNWIQDKYQKSVERKLAKPFARLVPNIVEPPIEDILKLSAPYVHDSFEGETTVSIGKMVELEHLGADGVISAGPFTCMPSTIVSAVMRRLNVDLHGMPMITLLYDGQGDPTLDTRLEAFVDQARSFQHRRHRADGRSAAVAHSVGV